MLCLSGVSQNGSNPFKVWQLTGYSGEVRLRGTYRESEVRGFNRKNDYYLSSMMKLQTRSFFVHPDFMTVNADATYNPETRRENYIGMPDYSEKINAEGVDVSALFFRKKKINLVTHARIANSIQNVESISKIKSKDKLFGATLNYSNKFLPLSIGYSKQKFEQKKMGSDRKYIMDQQIINAQASKSITSYDENTLRYLHTENTSWQNDNIFNNQPLSTQNTTDFVELINGIHFDPTQKYTFNSMITNSDQRGSFNFKRFQANERLSLKLPNEFVFTNTYAYLLSQLGSQKISNQVINSSLSHQLYKSLHSTLFYEYNQTKQTAYNDQRNKIGFDLNYTKQIPYGKLSLAYTYCKNYQKVKTDPTKIYIFYEEYILSDNQIILLKKQNIDIQSVIVKDITGTIIYQLNIDYILIDKNPYLEIVRIPGGLIANNSVVYIDYTAIQPGMYSYSMNSNSFSANVALFKDKLEVYYRVSKQNFDKPDNIENLVLDYYTRHIVGARFEFYFIKTGVEYDYLNSTILPYKGMRYFINIQKGYKRLFFTLYGNVQDFKMLDDGTKRQEIDITSKIAYTIYNQIKLDFDLMYRKQQGGGVDLNITTSRLELRSDFGKLFVSIGAELYLLKELQSNIEIKSIFIQLTRSF